MVPGQFLVLNTITGPVLHPGPQAGGSGWLGRAGDAGIALGCLIMAIALLDVARRRKDNHFDAFLWVIGAFLVACGGLHGAYAAVASVPVEPVALSWLKLVTAGLALAGTVRLLRMAPTLRVAPPFHEVMALDAALSTQVEAKRKAEGQLRETQDRFRLLVEGIKDYALLLLDPDGRVTSWNPGAERIKGYTDSEILGQPYARFFPAEDVVLGKPGLLLQQAAAKGRIEDEGWRVRKDGSRYFANMVITAFYDGNHHLQGFAQVVRDITEQRSTQAALVNLAETLEDKVRTQVQELRENEARLQGFIRHASAAIAFKDAGGSYLLINPRMATLIGRPSPDILGRRNEDLFPPDVCAQFGERDQQVLTLRRDIQTDVQWLQSDGLIRHFLVHKFPLVDATGQCWGLGIIATEITERTQAERALLQSQKLESLGVLAGGIAHDFNNLLGAVQGNVELALGVATLAEANPYLATVTELLAKGADLLRQLLAYAGKGSSLTRILDLNQLVTEMTHLLGTSISKKAVVQLQLGPGPLALMADASQIQQVIMNLVINASEALAEHSGTITVRTGLELVEHGTLDGGFESQPLQPGDYALLEVSDDGVGMSPEVLKRIFDPFFTTKFTGRGLGLAALHGIVRAHHGGVRVVSRAGLGSTFTILLPASHSPVPPEPLDRVLLAPDLSVLPEVGLILVVDDEEPMRRVVVRALQRAGFRTIEAGDGREALDRYDQYRAAIRLVLMDLTMPNLDGAEACRELGRRGAAVPILLSSGFNEADALRRFHGLGLAGFIQKPFRLTALVEQVNRILAH